MLWHNAVQWGNHVSFCLYLYMLCKKLANDTWTKGSLEET